MSKKINVNPDHYKVGGRERPGDDVPADREKRTLSEAKAGSRAATAPNRKSPPASRKPRKKK
ncbi:MAG: hypothetical protein ABR576_13400 [Thermoanaerobaculia bacterium]